MNENEIQFLRRTVDSFGKSYKPHFHQFGIPFIVSLIQNVPALKIELDQLVSKHKSLDLQSRIERVWNNGSQSIGEVMPDLKDDYSLYVTFCWQWLLHAIERGNGNTSLMRWQGDDNVVSQTESLLLKDTKYSVSAMTNFLKKITKKS
jgi:hypothetical protein